MAYPLWDWSLREGSALIDQGADAYYTTDNFYGNADFAGQTRLQGTIDIGAYEYQPMPAGRVLRVKAGASAAGADGLTWETAYPNVQDAINALYGSGGQGTGEVWVAAGDYAPTELLVPGEAATAAFIMRDGISVYGGFAGTETARAERTKSGDMPWQYEHMTRLIGSGYSENLEWNATDHRWTLNSRSNHVVWFADADGQTAFGQETVLDGVTIMGGQASTASSGAAWMGDRGAGVYMHNTNARLTNCVVTENVSGNHARRRVAQRRAHDRLPGVQQRLGTGRWGACTWIIAAWCCTPWWSTTARQAVRASICAVATRRPTGRCTRNT